MAARGKNQGGLGRWGQGWPWSLEMAIHALPLIGSPICSRPIDLPPKLTSSGEDPSPTEDPPPPRSSAVAAAFTRQEPWAYQSHASLSLAPSCINYPRRRNSIPGASSLGQVTAASICVILPVLGQTYDWAAEQGPEAMKSPDTDRWGMDEDWPENSEIWIHRH